MCSFLIQGNICGLWPSLDAAVVEVAVDSCFCCVRLAGLLVFALWLPSSVSEEALASSISVKCVVLVRFVPAVDTPWSERGEELLGPRLSLLLAHGRGSGDASEQLDGCLKRVSGTGDWKPRELSPTAPKWPALPERLTVRSIPL